MTPPDAGMPADAVDEREREETLAVIRQLSGAGPLTYMKAQSAGLIHELADRRCAVRNGDDHVHDGARCVRCRGAQDETPHEACVRAMHADPDVVSAQAKLNALDVEMARAELVLGRAINRARRAYWEATRT